MIPPSRQPVVHFRPPEVQMYAWLSTVNDKFWLILNYSKVIWDIDIKVLPVVVLMRNQLSAKFGASRYTENGFPAKTILNFKRWAHFLSHTHETQEICFFFLWCTKSCFIYLTVCKLKNMLNPSSPGVQSFLGNAKWIQFSSSIKKYDWTSNLI